MTRVTAVLIILGAMFALTVGPAEAQDYSERSLRGSYIFRGYGTVGGVDTPSVGRNVYDGAGGCESRAFLNFGGTIVEFNTRPAGGSCSYTVTPKGYAELSLVYIGPEGPVPFDVQVMIVDDRPTSGEAFWTATDPSGSTVGRGVLKKQTPGLDASNFGDRSMRGTWTFRTTGTVQGVDTPATGRISYDGAGTCSEAESWTLLFGGTLVPLGPATTCTYSVSPWGLYRSSYVGRLADGTPAAFDWVAFVVDDTNQNGELWAVIVDTDGQTVGRGVGKKQKP